MNDFKYYMVLSGRVSDVIKEAEKLNADFVAAAAQACTVFGAKKYVLQGDRVVGFVFAGDAPEGFRVGDEGYSYPNRKTKAGRALYDQLQAMPLLVTTLGFSQMLESRVADCGWLEFREKRVLFTRFEAYGDSRIIIRPAGCHGEPPDCEQIKASQYWRIREMHEQEGGPA